MSIIVKFKKLHSGAKLPLQMTTGSIGLDLYAHLLGERGQPLSSILPPRSVKAIPTGLAIEPPERQTHMGIGDRNGNQWLTQVVSRSGLARDYGIFVVNAPGIIDPDYRGELLVLLYNGGIETQYIQHGMRIAQLILVRTEYALPIEVEELTPSSRGANGLGSTGR